MGEGFVRNHLGFGPYAERGANREPPGQNEKATRR